jgi:hypothetical protein
MERAAEADRFSVALSGDTALAGVPPDEVGRGSVHVLARSGGTWSDQGLFSADGGADVDYFGWSVALSGDTALVGAPNDDVGGNLDQGSADVFTLAFTPVTTATLSPPANASGWNPGAVTVTLSAGDVDSSVASTEYRLLGAGLWTPYTAPLVVSGSGVSTYEYRSTDVDGNTEVAQSLTLRIDTSRPVTRALANVAVARYHKVTLRLRANDTVSPKATVTVRIYKGTLLKQTLKLGLRKTNSEIRYVYTCRLARGSYTWKVYATDLAGNKQRSPVGARTLTVR